MEKSRISRLGTIGAISVNETAAIVEEDRKISVQESRVEPIAEQREIFVYKMVVELSEEEKDKFLDYKYQLVQKYGAATNKDVLIDALKALYSQNVNIPARPATVRAQENITRRAVKTVSARRKG